MSKVQITAFTGEYYFLSNYCTCPITIDGLTYRSAEAAFQAAKCNVPIDRAVFCTVPPNVAMAIGRKIKLRKGWEKERDGIMADIIHAKFSQNPGFAQALIDTGDAELIEGNTWNDNYWGMCRCTRCRSGTTFSVVSLIVCRIMPPLAVCLMASAVSRMCGHSYTLGAKSYAFGPRRLRSFPSRSQRNGSRR